MLWGQASVLAAFGRVQHLTRGRPLTDAAGASPCGQTRSTRSLAIQPAGQTDVCLAHAELATKPKPPRSTFHHYPSESVHSVIIQYQ